MTRIRSISVSVVKCSDDREEAGIDHYLQYGWRPVLDELRPCAIQAQLSPMERKEVAPPMSGDGRLWP
jgi:hypothetical protein